MRRLVHGEAAAAWLIIIIIIIISDEFALYYGWFVDAFHIVWWLTLRGGVVCGG